MGGKSGNVMMPRGGAGKGGGGGSVIAPGQAGGAAGVTGSRQQRLADAVKKVGVRSGAAGGLTSPPSPRVRPTGPSGPGVDPGTAYGGSVPGGPLPEGMTAPALASVFGPGLTTTGGAGVFGTGPGEDRPLDAEAERRRRVQQLAGGMGGNFGGRVF
jgi:hypothetical protein